MKTLICYFLLVLFLVTAFPLPAEITILFEDDFSDNSNSWALGDDASRSMYLENGKYYFYHKEEEGTWFNWNFVNIDPDLDFVIRSTMKLYVGDESSGFGLVWGMEDVENYLTFNISGDGYYRYARESGSNWDLIIPWTDDFSVHMYNLPNILEVKKNRDNYEFYVNGNYLASSPFSGFSGEKLGFMVNNYMKIEIDDLLVAQYPAYTKVHQARNVYFDDFQDNNYNWITRDDEQVKLEVVNSSYQIQVKIDGISWRSWYKMDYDPAEDFVITAEMRQLAGDDDLPCGLAWGFYEDGGYHLFQLTETGYYSLSRLIGDEWEDIIGWHQSPHINSDNQKNRVEIRKVGDYYSFYINEVMIDFADYSWFPGTEVGFYVQGPSTAALDMLSVQQLEEDYEYREIKSERNPFSKLFTTPEIRGNDVYLELVSPEASLELDGESTLKRKLMIGYMIATPAARNAELVIIRTTDNNGRSRLFKAASLDIQKVMKEQISEEEFIGRLIIE